MDRSRRFRRCVAWNPAGKGKLSEQPLHSLLILGYFRVYLAITSLQVGIGYDPWRAMTRSSYIDDIEVFFFYNPIQMYIYEVQSRGAAPVAQKTGFNLIERDW